MDALLGFSVADIVKKQRVSVIDRERGDSPFNLSQSDLVPVNAHWLSASNSLSVEGDDHGFEFSCAGLYLRFNPPRICITNHHRVDRAIRERPAAYPVDKQREKE